MALDIEMAKLTAGIFGSASGLITLVIEKVSWVISNLPWCDLGQGFRQFIEGILNLPFL